MHEAAARAIKDTEPGDEPREARVAKWHGATAAAGTAQRRVLGVQRANPTEVLVKLSNILNDLWNTLILIPRGVRVKISIREMLASLLTSFSKTNVLYFRVCQPSIFLD
jgi:hypothetical protein